MVDFRSPDNPEPFTRELAREDDTPVPDRITDEAHSALVSVATRAATTVVALKRGQDGTVAYTLGALHTSLDAIEAHLERLRRFIAAEQAASRRLAGDPPGVTGWNSGSGT